jgi:hypothetical protein
MSSDEMSMIMERLIEHQVTGRDFQSDDVFLSDYGKKMEKEIRKILKVRCHGI